MSNSNGDGAPKRFMSVRELNKTRRGRKMLMAAAKNWGEWQPAMVSEDDARAISKLNGLRKISQVFVNSKYSVQVYENDVPDLGVVVQLAIRAHLEGVKEIPWADRQRIKNELCHPECLAVEINPAESDVIDQSDMYHLWVLPRGVRYHFGLAAGQFGWGRMIQAKEGPKS